MKIDLGGINTAKFEVTEDDVAAIEKILNDRGNQAVLIKIENGKLVIFSIQPKIVVKR